MEQQLNAGVLSEFLGKVRGEMIPGYMPKKVTANVMPPVDTTGRDGPRISGMDPDAIKDPAAREHYIQAIRENSLNNACNTRQSMLSDIIENYVIHDANSSVRKI